jgi:NADH:ubiquinone oxidoreductase subunit 2 (subunit N)
MDLLTFFISLEAQNFCFLVLCGLPGVTSMSGHNNLKDSTRSFGVEAALKYFLLSAFSSGVILFWFSYIYTYTGMSVFSFNNVLTLIDYANPQNTFFGARSPHSNVSPLTVGEGISVLDGGSLFMILTAMMFKIGAAPLHLWVVQIYSAVRRNLIMYIATAPKLSLFLFWVNSFQTVWSDYTLLLFSAFSLFIGAFGAYSQPGLRSLLAYSTVNEVGLLLAALDTAGFHTLFQHLGIYIISQVLLWNLNDKRPFTLVAVSLAGLPPLAGFFGKAWIFWHVSSVGYYSLLAIMLLCTVVSLVYYLRVVRLFYGMSKGVQTRKLYYSLKGNSMNSLMSLSASRVYLVSFLLLLLIVLPFFLIKPLFVA